MKSLDSASEHLWGSSHLGDLHDWQASIPEGFGCSTRGDQGESQFWQFFAKWQKVCLVRDAEKGWNVKCLIKKKVLIEWLTSSGVEIYF